MERSRRMDKAETLREAPFAIRVTERKEGKAAIVYRRRADAEGRDRLQRVGAISPLAFSAATPMLREAIASSRVRGQEESNGVIIELTPGPFHPVDADWGVRVACYAIISTRLRDGERLMLAANHLRYANPDEAAWWLGRLAWEDNVRALRALRILTEAVQ